MMDRRIGAQLFTVRDLCRDAAGLDATLARLEKIGYKQVQISGIGDIAPEEIRRICDAHGMGIICTHKGGADYAERMGEMIDFHKKLGCDIAGLGMDSAFMDMTTADEVRAEGTPEAIVADPDSVTGRFLMQERRDRLKRRG